MTILLKLPYPPTINNYYGRKRNGQVYIKPHGVQYRQEVIDLLKDYAEEIPLDYQVSIKVYLFPPDRRRRDIDNVKKALYDSLTHASIYTDDSLISIENTFKFKDILNCCIVEIEKLDDDYYEKQRKKALKLLEKLTKI